MAGQVLKNAVQGHALNSSVIAIANSPVLKRVKWKSQLGETSWQYGSRILSHLQTQNLQRQYPISARMTLLDAR